MPLYEYRCSKCGATVETLQGVHDAPLKKCRECGGRLVKLISAPAIQFKGNGWYITDYAKKSSAPAGPSGEPSNGDKRGAKTETAVDAKAAASGSDKSSS
jgi:putative FmdB family regulatory protein